MKCAVLLQYIYNWQHKVVVERAVTNEVCSVVAVHLQLAAGVGCGNSSDKRGVLCCCSTSTTGCIRLLLKEQ